MLPSVNIPIMYDRVLSSGSPEVCLLPAAFSGNERYSHHAETNPRWPRMRAPVPHLHRTQHCEIAFCITWPRISSLLHPQLVARAVAASRSHCFQHCWRLRRAWYGAVQQPGRAVDAGRRQHARRVLLVRCPPCTGHRAVCCTGVWQACSIADCTQQC